MDTKEKQKDIHIIVDESKKTTMGPQAGNMIITTIMTGNRTGECK